MAGKTHWRKLDNPDYLGAYALEPGQDMILTIKTITTEDVVGEGGIKKMCTVAHFAEAVKPMVLNAVNRKTLQKIYSTPYIEDWIGRKIQLFVKKDRVFGEIMDVIRIRPFVPQIQTNESEKHECLRCGALLRPFDKMTALQLATYTQSKYGMILCADCAKGEASKKTDVLAESEDETDYSDIGISEGADEVTESEGFLDEN